MKLCRLLALLLLPLVVSIAPAADNDKILSRIAFGSCADQDKPQPLWNRIVADKPDVFLFIGDIVYGDTEKMDVLRAKYKKLLDLPGYQQLLKTCPVLATWDDHDYGANDAGEKYPRKVESQEIFLDFLGIAKDSPRRKQPGIYHAEVVGPPGKRVQMIVLDTRYFRSDLKKDPKTPRGVGPYLPVTDPKATMLGETQWKWLAEQLKVPAEVRILVSSIQVVPEDHGWEKWMNIPHERERLYKLLRDSKATGLFVISGDRHLAELSMQPDAIGYPLYDLTSSGINQADKKWRKLETNRHRIATMNYGDNYGLIVIDWERKDPRISLQIRDDDGEIILQQKINLSLLQPNGKEPSAPGVKLSTGEPLSADLIAKNLDKEVTIEMTVQATGMSTKFVFLNSEKDRKSETNFTVVLSAQAQESLKKAGIDQPREQFSGKKIRVKGKLSKFQGQAQITVDDAAQIEIIKE